MTTPTTTRGRGRPRKQPENPDCEPATKGYVKCVARKLISGPIDKAGGAFNSAIIWMIIAAAFTVTMCAISGPHTDPFSTLNWATVAFMISFALGVHDVVLGYYLFSYPEQYDYVRKYKPPCEPKRGCEEQE